MAFTNLVHEGCWKNTGCQSSIRFPCHLYRQFLVQPFQMVLKVREASIPVTEFKE